MSVDTVNFGLTHVTRQIQEHPDSFSPGGLTKLLTICGCMRDYLMRDDAPGFSRYVDDLLAREPDAADFILEELFNVLLCHDREAFDKELAEM